MGELFAGIGGFSLGFQRAGFEVAWQVEIEPYCRKVLERHFPEAERHNDVREVGKHNLKPVDVICGGFPCQDISQCNTTGARGLDGARSGLWSEYLRIVGELRPRYILVENSAALLFRGLGTILGDLASCGYDAEWQCLPAAAFGAPHIRDRVWILAYPGRESCPDIRQLSVRRDLVFPQREHRSTTERGQDWELVEMVPGIHQGVVAEWWRTQSRVARSADGIRDGMERRKAIGNAVVPQIPEWIANRILEASKG